MTCHNVIHEPFNEPLFRCQVRVRGQGSGVGQGSVRGRSGVLSGVGLGVYATQERWFSGMSGVSGVSGVDLTCTITKQL